MKHVAFASSAPLSDDDWKIVELARTESPQSLDPHSFLSRVSSVLFGIRIARPLANDRLEALRCFAVRAWNNDLIRTRHLCDFLNAGFSPRHVRQVLAYVATYRGFTPSIQDWIA